ncbi:hypothetical protein KQI52_07435 [bacterium]|nr:hypothetical protein [bacterium]
MKTMMMAALAMLLLVAGFTNGHARDPHLKQASPEMKKTAVDGNTWTANDGETFFTCPVCQMLHTMDEAKGQAVVDDETFYLCHSSEQAKLTSSPEKYLGESFFIPANLETYGSSGATYRDPVNGETGTLSNQTKSVKIGHKRYFFVNEENRDQFKANPDKYLVALDEGDR